MVLFLLEELVFQVGVDLFPRFHLVSRDFDIFMKLLGEIYLSSRPAWILKGGVWNKWELNGGWFNTLLCFLSPPSVGYLITQRQALCIILSDQRILETAKASMNSLLAEVDIWNCNKPFLFLLAGYQIWIPSKSKGDYHKAFHFLFNPMLKLFTDFLFLSSLDSLGIFSCFWISLKCYIYWVPVSEVLRSNQPVFPSFRKQMRYVLKHPGGKKSEWFVAVLMNL